MKVYIVQNKHSLLIYGCFSNRLKADKGFVKIIIEVEYTHTFEGVAHSKSTKKVKYKK